MESMLAMVGRMPPHATLRMLQVCAVDFTAYHLLAPLMRASREAGWDVEFACAPGRWISTLEHEGFRYRPIPVARSVSPLRHLRAASALALQLRRGGIDLIHTHTPAGGLVGRLAALAAPDMPVVHTFHGLPFEGEPRSVVERGFAAVERALARRTSFFFSQAIGDLERACRSGFARAADSLVIGNGVDTDRFAPDQAKRASARAELGVPPGAVLVMSIGRLVREKGHLELADAAFALRDRSDLRVAVVGETLSSDRAGIVRELREHPATTASPPPLRLLGHRTDADRLLAASDIFVLASYREGLPRSVIEAMAAGLPVVVSDIPACRELVEDGQSGLLVPPRDPGALARALERLVAEPTLRRMMGARGRELAMLRHRERDVVGRQLPILERVARDGR